MQWYEQLFSNFANNYDNQPFTQGTQNEVNFLEEETGFNKSAKILDIGCGTGRHSIELAKRGYAVTGIDLSQNMLAKAKEKALKANVSVNFQQADARTFTTNELYNLVIILCEGGLSLMETDEMNFAILKNAANALAPGGKLIFTCLNALYPLFHNVKDVLDSGQKNVVVGETDFNLLTFREKQQVNITDDDGKSFTLDSDERYFAPSEISFMLNMLGCKKVEFFGDPTGNYSRERPLTTDSFEMLVVAEK